MTEAPTGEIDREPEVPDPAVVREAEALAFAQGRELYATAALDARRARSSPTPTSASTPRAPRAPTSGAPWSAPSTAATGSGMAVKVANLRQLQRARPDLGQVVTWNAEVNAHMIGVNEAMGFVPVERSGEVQKARASREPAAAVEAAQSSTPRDRHRRTRRRRLAVSSSARSVQSSTSSADCSSPSRSQVRVTVSPGR